MGVVHPQRVSGALLGTSAERSVGCSSMCTCPTEYSGRWHHIVNVRNADEVDDLVRDWLTDAYVLEID